MERKEIKKQRIYYKEQTTSLKTIHQFVGSMPARVAQEMQEQNLTPVGDQVWRYIGSDGNPNTEFTLQVGFPVEENCNVNSEFPAFNCITHVHNGSWSEFGKVYEQLIGAIMVEGHQLSGETREIYKVVDFENQENNVTEIQIGIQ